MKVIVYGIGNNFTRNYKWLEENFEICGLVDSSVKKQGKKIGRHTVEDITNIHGREFDKILVTPNAYFEITKMLLEYGVSKEKICYLYELQKLGHVGNSLKIAFRLNGGMGDGLIGLNYIWYFRERFKQDNIRLYIELEPKRDAVKHFIRESDLVEDVVICKEEEAETEKYDLYIRLKRYPEVMHADMHVISRIAPELVDYILLCEKFKIFHPRFFESDFVADGGSALLEELNGRTRIVQPDIYGFFAMDEVYKFPIQTTEAPLDKFELKKGKYITVHRGCEKQYYNLSSTKLWPVEYYNDLLLKLEQKYPDISIVLIGAEHEREKDILFSGKNLVGKTNFSELQTILKYARIHIDTEGGCVHLRHALHGGPSIVLFGPTSDHFFGYRENINLRSDICSYPCEWTALGWSRKCIISDGQADCMKAILPESVLEAADRLMRCVNEQR